MASTPSAPALSAVLRCRGNIWTRNRSNKRPATAGYSLGLAGGALRDSLAERSRSKRASAWEAFLQGDRVVVGRRLAVAYKSPRGASNTLRGKDFREKKLRYSKLSLSTGEAHSCDQSALVRQLACRLVFKLPGVDACSKIILMPKCETYAEHICKLAFVQEVSGSPAFFFGVLKVSIMSPRLVEHAEQLMKTVKSTCRSLPARVSGMMLWRFKSSTEGASQLLWQRDEKIIKHNVLQVRLNLKKLNKHYLHYVTIYASYYTLWNHFIFQANGHSSTDLTSSKGNSSCGQKITEDRPD